MPMLNVIEFLDDSKDIMVFRVPQEGSGEFKLGDQVIVQESQVAVFVRDGQALDGFRAGRHTLTTQNLPLLGKLIGGAFGGASPFRSCVYFIASRTFTNLGWGTPTPVLFRDAEFRMISLRAHGVFSFRILKARLFLNTIVGTRGLETTYAMEEFFRSIIVAKLNETLGSRMKSVLDLPVQYGNIATDVKQSVAADFEQYGIELVDLMVEAITPPPEVQEMMNRASGVAAQDADKYRAVAAADAMRDAARNAGGSGGGPLEAGLGLAMGMGLAQQFTMTSPQTPSANPSPAASPSLSMDVVRAKLIELKKLLDEGLITTADFDEQKRRLLAQI